MDSFLYPYRWLAWCVMLLVLMAAATGCAQLRGTLNPANESPYATAPPAPPFDGTNATVVDPASVPPIIRGATPTPPPTSLPISQPPSPPNSFDVEQVEQLKQRVRDLDLKLASRDADIARQASELRLLEQSTILPEVMQTVSKPIVTSETPMLLPVIQLAGVDVQQQRGTIRITIPDSMLFQNGTYQLLSTGEETLTKVMDEVKVSYPSATIEIEGHSDNIVTNPQNPTQLQEITCYKASILMKVLVSQLGIDAKFVRPTGFGGTLPIADNTTEEGREQNRRFVFVLIPTR